MNLKAILIEVFDMEEQDFSEELLLKDLDGWDSMTHMLFISRIEEELKVELSGDEIVEMISLKSILSVLDRKKVIYELV